MRSRPLPAVLLALVLPGVAAAAEPPVLELSLEQACARALENSPDIAVERLADQGYGLALRELERGYEPYLSSVVQQGSKREPAQDTAATRPTIKTDSFDWGLTVDQPLQTGAALRFDMQNGRLDSTNPLSLWRSGYTTTLQLGLVQPLWRNFKVDDRRHRIRVAKKNRAISDLAFREAVLNITAELKVRYYALLFAIDNRDVHAQVFEMVRRMQEDNRERVKAGILPRFDLLLGDSELAARRETLTVAEADLARAEDALKRLLLKPGDLEGWKARVRPTDNPTVEPVPVDAEAAAQVALAGRTDVQAARLSLERGELVQLYAKNQSRPGLDLALTYGTLGFGGTQVVPAGSDGTARQTSPRSYGGALSEALDSRYPSWAVGLNFSYPILNRAAGTAVARAQVGRDLAAAQVAVLEQSVIAEVRDAARSVEIGFVRVREAREALGFQKQRLDAEMERFKAGKSSAFFVIQAQRDLVITQLTERDAVAAYRRSLVRYERVQAAGIGADGYLQ